MSRSFLLLLPAFVSVVAAGAPSVNTASLPLAFEAAPGTAQYLARGAGLHVAVQATGVDVHAGKRSGPAAAIRLHFSGASAKAVASVSNKLPGTSNYFIGSDPSKWRTGVSTFGQVEFQGVYPGIDVVYYGNQSRLEYDFRVHAGANPSAIRLTFDGSARPALSPEGDLLVGELLQHRPVAYQNAANGRVPVACRYVIRQSGEVALALGAYDRNRELIIDPVLRYASYMGGTLNDGVTSIKVDAAGSVYMTGFTASSNFPAKGGSQNSYGGSNSEQRQGQFGDAFVAKLNPAGTAVVYATYLGGSGEDLATSIAIDSAGNAYVAGSTQSANFPVSASAPQRVYKGFTNDNGFYNPGDGFAVKLNAAGNQLVYATYLGGGLNDLAMGIAVDNGGNAVVVGATTSSDFPTTAGAAVRVYRGANNTGPNFGPSIAGDGFITIINAAGSAFSYSTFFGGAGRDGVSCVALDAQNNIYVGGLTLSSDFPVTPGAFQSTFKGVPTITNGTSTVPGDGFVAKLTSQGSVVYTTFLGGARMDAVTGIAADAAGAAYVTGGTLSTDFPVSSGAAQSAYRGSGGVGTIGASYGGDAFVAKLNPTGTALGYSTYLGGAGDEGGLGIAVDGAGSAFVTGFTLSNDFPKSADALQASNGGFGGQGIPPNSNFNLPERARNTGDAFLTQLSATGAITYSSFYGGTRDDAGAAIALDAGGNPYIGGNTLSASLAGTTSGAQSALAGIGQSWPRGDGFVARFDFGGKIPAQPARINVVAGFSGAGTVSARLATPFTVEVLDAAGAGVANAVVTFAATGASVSPASATTDAQGRASTTVTLGATTGSGSVTATVAGLPVATAALTISAAAQGPVVSAVVNGASFLPALAGGSWITAYVNVTAAANATATTVPLPTTLGGFRILVNGTPIPMYLVFALSPGTQLNAQLPYGLAAGTAQVVVEQNGVASAAFPITVQPSAPGIFVFGNNRAVAQNVAPDGSVSVNTADNGVPAGDYIIAYFTGQGALNNPVPTGGLASGSPLSIPTLPYSATLDGAPVSIAFLGMTPGQIALGQANIQIPRETKPGTYPLVIRIGDTSSNGPLLTVTAPRP